MKPNLSGNEPPWQAAQAGLGRYAHWLTTVGVERGLIGPREAGRIWPRHLLNCAVVVLDPAVDVPDGASIIDVGSGAGLPGIVWALVRPDVTVTLVDSMKRRTTFLEETVELLAIGNRVRVVRARAEDLVGAFNSEIVTARAVTPLPRLVRWTLPLVEAGGQLLALKGRTAEAELESARVDLRRAGAVSAEFKLVGGRWMAEPTGVVVVRKG